MYIYICSDQYRCMLAFGCFSNHEVLVATWAPHAVPSTAGVASVPHRHPGPRVQRWYHTELRDTGRRRFATRATPTGQTGGTAAHPADAAEWSRIQRKPHVSTVPIKNKLCDVWIRVFCSPGTVRSRYVLMVARGGLSRCWKHSLTDRAQQDRPVCLHRERFPYRPAPGQARTEKGWQSLLVYFLLFPSMKDHFGFFSRIWGWVLPLLQQTPARDSTGTQSNTGMRHHLAVRSVSRCPAGLTAVFAFLTGLWFLPHCFHWLHWGPHQGRTFLRISGQLPFGISQSQSMECLRVLCRYILKSLICDPIWLQRNKVAC